MFHTFTQDNLHSANSHFMFIQVTSLLSVLESSEHSISIYGDLCEYLWKCSTLCCSPSKYSSLELVVRKYGPIRLESVDITVHDLETFTLGFEDYFFSPNVLEVVDMNNGGKEIVIEFTNPLDTDINYYDEVRIIIRAIEAGTMSSSHTCAFNRSLIVWDGVGFTIPRGDRVATAYLEKLIGRAVDVTDACQLSGVANRVAVEVFEKKNLSLLDVSFLDSLETWFTLSEICEERGNLTLDTPHWTFTLFRDVPDCGADDDVCAICMESVNHKRVGKRIHTVAETSCKHKYHLGCMASWIHACEKGGNPKRCPSCKRDICLDGAAFLRNIL